MKIINQVTCTIEEVEGAPTLQDVLDRKDIPDVTIKVFDNDYLCDDLEAPIFYLDEIDERQRKCSALIVHIFKKFVLIMI